MSNFDNISITGSEDQNPMQQQQQKAPYRFDYSPELKAKIARYRAKGIKYELTIQEEIDEQYRAKTAHAQNSEEVVIAIYRVRAANKKEFVTWNVRQSALTNLDNTERNYPAKKGLYKDAELKRTGYLTDDGVLKSRPAEIERMHDIYEQPFEESFVRMLFEHSDPYEVKFGAMNANDMHGVSVHDLDLFIYMDMDQILKIGRSKELNWPSVEDAKAQYDKRMESIKQKEIEEAQKKQEAANLELNRIKEKQMLENENLKRLQTKQRNVVLPPPKS